MVVDKLSELLQPHGQLVLNGLFTIVELLGNLLIVEHLQLGESDDFLLRFRQLGKHLVELSDEIIILQLTVCSGTVVMVKVIHVVFVHGRIDDLPVGVDEIMLGSEEE